MIKRVCVPKSGIKRERVWVCVFLRQRKSEIVYLTVSLIERRKERERNRVKIVNT